ncbi:MAG: hypothetical protein ACHREM_20710 [Polyangiales bacterium]
MQTTDQDALAETPRRREGRATPLRIAIGCAIIAAWCLAWADGARVGGPVVGIIAGVMFTVPLTSLGEWWTHGVLYHGHTPGLAFIRTIHHQGHHFALFPPDRYVQHGRYEFMRFREPLVPFQMSDNWLDNALTSWSQILLHFVVGIPLVMVPAWLLAPTHAFAGSCLASLAIISWLLAYVHGVIHTPRNRLIERMGWFQWLDRHHYIHHVDLQANINFMLPICDFLFGTQKWALTEKEQARVPTFAGAKPMAGDVTAEELAAAKST